MVSLGIQNVCRNSTISIVLLWFGGYNEKTLRSYGLAYVAAF